MIVTERTSESMFERGLGVRREVLGKDYVDRSMVHQDPLTVEFQEFVSTYCWGEIWTDERLSRRDRSLIVMAMTAALGKEAEFEIHVNGALRNGVTAAELASLMRQIAVYCGVPAGVTAHKIARKVLARHTA